MKALGMRDWYLLSAVLTSNIIVSLCTNNVGKVTVHFQNQTIGSSTQHFMLNDHDNSVNISIKSETTFFVIHLHSVINNITISTTPTFDKHTIAEGQNVGIVTHVLENPTSLTFYVTGFSAVQVLLVVNSYEKDDPVPGGCNLTSDLEEDPNLVVHYNDDMITVQHQMASLKSQYCELNDNVSYQLYILRLKRWDFSAETFIDGIRRMMDVDQVLQNGIKVTKTYKSSYYLSNYIGFGTVYSVIAKRGDARSLYVSTVDYGCDINNPETCYDFFSRNNITLGILLIAAGILVLCIGGRLTTGLCIFFATTVVCDPLLAALIGTHSLYVTVPVTLISATLIAIFAAMVSTYVNAIFAGYLFACSIFFSSVIGDLELFNNDWYYHLIFTTTVFLITLVCLTVALFIDGSSIFIGSIMILNGLSLAFCGTYYFMLITQWRHVYNHNFVMATIEPPITSTDIVSMVCTVIMTLVAVWSKWNRRVRSTPETTPLLRGTRTNRNN